MTDPDEPLVAALRTGDREALRRLFERHHRSMLRVAERITASREDAEDVVQEAFVGLRTSMKSFRGQSTFRTWLYRVVTNRAFSRARAREIASTGLALDALPAPPRREAESEEVLAAVDREIDDLPLRQRTVFVLSAVEGLAPREVAEVLDLDAGTVRYHLFKARERLRQRLGWLLRHESRALEGIRR